MLFWAVVIRWGHWGRLWGMYYSWPLFLFILCFLVSHDMNNPPVIHSHYQNVLFKHMGPSNHGLNPLKLFHPYVVSLRSLSIETQMQMSQYPLPKKEGHGQKSIAETAVGTEGPGSYLSTEDWLKSSLKQHRRLVEMHSGAQVLETAMRHCSRKNSSFIHLRRESIQCQTSGFMEWHIPKAYRMTLGIGEGRLGRKLKNAQEGALQAKHCHCH